MKKQTEFRTFCSATSIVYEILIDVLESSMEYATVHMQTIENTKNTKNTKIIEENVEKNLKINLDMNLKEVEVQLISDGNQLSQKVGGEGAKMELKKGS